MIGDDLRRVLAQAKALPKDQQLAFIRSELAKIRDPEERQTAELYWTLGYEFAIDSTQEQVVVLIHGIRTFANWQEAVAERLREIPGIHPYPIGYGYFDVARFLFPVFTRRYPVSRVLRELRALAARHRTAKVTVVAHSFGTYVISKILSREPDVIVDRLLLCGSVIPENFRWDMIPKRPQSIVNEVGTRDPYPLLAKKATWGYGASGVFGFKTHAVRDRFHDFDHSDFFSPEHLNGYWIPFIADGRIVSSPWDAQRPSPPIWMSLFVILPTRLTLLAALAASIWVVLS